MKIEFEPEAHAYTIDGRPVPSVTQVLGPLSDFGFVNADVMARAQQFGKAVHKAVELSEAGTLDMAELDPLLVPYLDGYLLWRAHLKPDVVRCEVRVGSSMYGYAGTLDILATKDRRRILVDVKSGGIGTVGPQTAAYKQAAEETTGEGIHERKCLKLTAKGPRVVLLEDGTDWSVFLSCLNIRNFKEKRRAA